MTARSKAGGADVAFPPPLVFLGFLGAGLAIQRFFPLALPLAWPRVIAGAAIALAGVACVVAARIWFFRTRQNPAPWKPSPELIVHGIYKHTRNPMYLGITLFELGLGTALANVWIMLLAPVALLVVHVLAVRPEEAYLAETFGGHYLTYKASVRRYL